MKELILGENKAQLFLLLPLCPCCSSEFHHASVHICLLVCSGEEVFIIVSCLGAGIKFLYLCPHWLPPDPLGDTLYLLNCTSLVLSTCNTSTCISPSLPLLSR